MSGKRKRTAKACKELDNCELSQIDNSTHTLDISDTCLREGQQKQGRHVSKRAMTECIDFIAKLNN